VSGRARVLAVIAGRLVNAVMVLLVLSVLVFGFMRAIPGDPVLNLLGETETTAGQYDALKARLGLDRPFHVQYLAWISRVVQGDFGQSLRTHEPVLPVIWEKLKATIELALVSVLFGTLIGIAAGVVSAVKRDSAFDSGAMLASLVGISMPVFWMGILLIIVFSVKLDLLPVSGMVSFDTSITPVTGFPLLDAVLTGNWRGAGDLLAHLVLPAIALGLTPAALIARTTRASMLEVINEDYVKAGLARGLSFNQTLWRHVMRNAMIPVVTVIGLEFGIYLGGSIVTENVFSWPGLGRHIIEAIYANDYPVVQGAVLVYAGIVVLINLIVDLSYSALDPRVKL
jgi:ABC-type dipeptide/oligopeptide/nickel transport system permease component